MATRKSSRVHRKYKSKYRVKNRREYERGLRQRGDVTVWFSEEAIDTSTPPKNGPIHLIVDSTGLKIFGSGEWNLHRHKRSKVHRAWRKPLSKC